MTCLTVSPSENAPFVRWASASTSNKRISAAASEAQSTDFLGSLGKNDLYFFRCCPFGAVFSQHWWGRVGGCTLRLLHTLIFFAHMGLLFVDNFIFSQAFSLMPLTGAVICLFLQVVGIPVSWKKLQISCRVDWIGWRLCFSAGTVSLRDEKRLRLLELVHSLLRSNGRVSSKDLESFLGLAMWACALFSQHAFNAAPILQRPLGACSDQLQRGAILLAQYPQFS